MTRAGMRFPSGRCTVTVVPGSARGGARKRRQVEGPGGGGTRRGARRLAFSGGQARRRRRPRLGEVGGDEAEADRAPERGRHAAGRDPPHEVVLALHDLARFWRNYRAVVGLQADEPLVVVALALPHQLWLAGEVLFVQLDGPGEARAVGPREPVGVLAYDEVAFLQAQDARRLGGKGVVSAVAAPRAARGPRGAP